MKFFAATCVLALAASTASAANCLLDINALTTAVLPIVAAAGDCSAATKFNIVPPTALPTAEQTKAICTQCQALITGAQALKFPDCTLTIDGAEMPVAKLFNQIVGQCDKSAAAPGAASNATTTAPGATTAAPAATTATTPASTTKAPAAKETAAGSTAGSSGAAAPTVEKISTAAPKTPASTTTAPKAASGAASASLGAAAAVACSLVAAAAL